ncbi:MAG: 16S rRNA (cytosine(1402)-N(4))-methyltransferase RsmH [Thermodesulfobacteriota bacterium]|nr:16S rRNA (cytosine(1402)-N(4))-methyltransferase RsmH [Thermodesulfobacteriota bacterium]
MDYPHQPVLVDEVVTNLISIPDGTYVDGTVGTGGHGLAIAESLSGKGRLICLDRDPDAVRISRQRLAFLGNRVDVSQASFTELDRVVDNLGFKDVDGVLLDLGMSSYQLEQSGKGFSFLRDEPLDMRMDPREELTAHHLVNGLSPRDLERVLRDYGEEKRAKSVARAIVRARRKRPIEATKQLAAVIESVFPPSHRFKARHPATLSFQALRIAVNKELQNIETFLNKIPELMAKGGRLVVLSYHSLEDRLIKHAMISWERPCVCPPNFPRCVCERDPIFRRIIKKGLKPGSEEIRRNPRARSARLRVTERI